MLKSEIEDDKQKGFEEQYLQTLFYVDYFRKIIHQNHQMKYFLLVHLSYPKYE